MAYTTHELKSWPLMFQPVNVGRKQFEIRKNDRNYQVGDHIRLMEFIPDDPEAEHPSGTYTGDWCEVEITYIMSNFPCCGAIKKDFVVMSISLV